MARFFQPSDGKVGKEILGAGKTYSERMEKLAEIIRQHEKIFIHTDMGSCQCGDFFSTVHRNGTIDGDGPEKGYGHGDAVRFALAAYRTGAETEINAQASIDAGLRFASKKLRRQIEDRLRKDQRFFERVVDLYLK